MLYCSQRSELRGRCRLRLNGSLYSWKNCFLGTADFSSQSVQGRNVSVQADPQQYKDGHITPEQLQSAYSTALSAALDCSNETHYTCLELLLESLKRAEDPIIAQTLRKTRIAVTPHIPHDDLRGYLDDLAWCILDTKSHTSERKDLVEMAFKMVLEGLPDENRRIGMGWWLRWKPQFQDHSSMNSPRAKL